MRSFNAIFDSYETGKLTHATLISSVHKCVNQDAPYVAPDTQTLYSKGFLMASLYIDLDISEIYLNAGSSYEKHDDDPIKRGKLILITGKPIYSSTYAFPEVIDFNSGGKRINLPEMITVRIKQVTESLNNIGTLNYVRKFSDNEIGIDEPNQFEAIVPYLLNEFMVPLALGFYAAKM